MKFFVCLFLSLLALSGCAKDPPFQAGSHLTLTDSYALPAPTEADRVTQDRPYRIGAYDRLSVNVFGVPDLTRSVRADASGRVSMPLIGTVSAQGLTPEELATNLENGLRRYVKDPQVTVNLEESVSQTVTIDGEVEKPGVYPVMGRMTLIRAVATAEGTTEFAKLEDVVVFRTVGAKQLAALYNLGAIRRGTYPDPEIFPNDVVVVGDLPARRLFKDLIQLSPLLTTPVVAVLNSGVL